MYSAAIKNESRRTWTSVCPPVFFNVWRMLTLTWWRFAPYRRTDHCLGMAVRRALIKSFDWCSMLRCRPFVVRTAVINYECHDLMSTYDMFEHLQMIHWMWQSKRNVNREPNGMVNNFGLWTSRSGVKLLGLVFACICQAFWLWWPDIQYCAIKAMVNHDLVWSRCPPVITFFRQ